MKSERVPLPGRRPRYRKWVHPFRDHPALAAAFDRGLAAMAGDFATWQRARGWTTAQVAAAAGLSEHGLRNFLNAHSDPKLSTLVRLAATFNVEVRVVLRPRVTSSLL